jgi:hypothetical protein
MPPIVTMIRRASSVLFDLRPMWTVWLKSQRFSKPQKYFWVLYEPFRHRDVIWTHTRGLLISNNHCHQIIIDVYL